MPPITTKDGTEIYYKDWGSGQRIVFSHSWPGMVFHFAILFAARRTPHAARRAIGQLS